MARASAQQGCCEGSSDKDAARDTVLNATCEGALHALAIIWQHSHSDLRITVRGHHATFCGQYDAITVVRDSEVSGYPARVSDDKGLLWLTSGWHRPRADEGAGCHRGWVPDTGAG